MTDVETALQTDRTIDIVTVGAKTGLKRITEIWFTNIQGRIIICGTPSNDGSSGRRRPRDWLANMKANPEFQFCFKETIKLCLPARAIPVVDTWDRRQIMSAPAARWYREQGCSIDDLVDGSPIVEVMFLDEYQYLNQSIMV
ncbi:MAG: nitroreductase/quinone reductase family protein [Geminicoccales bacterium]